MLDLASRQEVEGQVVRRRTYSRGNNKSDHYLGVNSAIGQGQGVAGPGGRLRPASGRQPRHGDHRARLGHMFQVDLVSGSRTTVPPPVAMVEGEAPAVTGSDRGVGASAATSLRSWGDTAVSIRL